MTDEPFALRRHVLGPIDLVPLDAAAIPALAARLAAIDPWLELGVTPEGWAARLAAASPGIRRFVVERDGATVGHVAVRHPFMRGPYLETMAIFPEARRIGAARAIVDWMAREVEGIDGNLWLCVSEWNTIARAAYAALGFVEIGPLPDLIAPGRSERFMRRTIAPPRG